MKPFIPVVALIACSSPTFAEEASNKEGIKTGAETVVNGAALMGVVGAMSGPKNETIYEGRKAGAQSWTELGDIQRLVKSSRSLSLSIAGATFYHPRSTECFNICLRTVFSRLVV